jgi:hypothetical protein
MPRSTTLANQTASSLSVFAPAGHVLDVLGVEQPTLEPLGLQQVEHRLPIIGCGLHRDQGHLQGAQPVGQPQQGTGGGGVLAHLLAAPAGLVRVRGTDTSHHRGLADVECGHPLHQFDRLVGLLQLAHLESVGERGEGGCPGSRQGKQQSRTRVLEATMRGPSTSSQRQTFRRAHQRHGSTDVDGQPAPIFSPAGRPAGTGETFRVTTRER